MYNIFFHFFYIRKEKILLAKNFRIIYFLVSIVLPVLKEMLSCRITCNLGIYLQKLYHKTCTFPLSSRILPKSASLNTPKTPTTSLVAGVPYFTSVIKEVGGKYDNVLSLKLYREDQLTSVSVPTDGTSGFLPS